jgi:hypothetical protein
VLVDVGNVLGGGKTSLLFTLVFPLPGAREATLRHRRGFPLQGTPSNLLDTGGVYSVR